MQKKFVITITRVFLQNSIRRAPPFHAWFYTPRAMFKTWTSFTTTLNRSIKKQPTDAPKKRGAPSHIHPITLHTIHFILNSCNPILPHPRMSHPFHTCWKIVLMLSLPHIMVIFLSSEYPSRQALPQRDFFCPSGQRPGHVLFYIWTDSKRR